MWTAIFLALGWLFRDQIQSVLEALSEAGGIALAALVVALAVFIAFRYWRRRTMLRLTGLPRVTVRRAVPSWSESPATRAASAVVPAFRVRLK